MAMLVVVIGKEAGGGGTHVMYGRSRMAIEPRAPTLRGRSTSGFHRPGRYCLHRARRAVRVLGTSHEGWAASYRESSVRVSSLGVSGREVGGVYSCAMHGRSRTATKRRGGVRGRGRGRVFMAVMTLIVRPQILASPQRRDRPRQVFTDQTDLVCSHQAPSET